MQEERHQDSIRHQQKLKEEEERMIEEQSRLKEMQENLIKDAISRIKKVTSHSSLNKEKLKQDAKKEVINEALNSK
jgi:DNA-binding protein H-NS